jgi:hypothetical protein
MQFALKGVDVEDKYKNDFDKFKFIFYCGFKEWDILHRTAGIICKNL